MAKRQGKGVPPFGRQMQAQGAVERYGRIAGIGPVPAQLGVVLDDRREAAQAYLAGPDPRLPVLDQGGRPRCGACERTWHGVLLQSDVS